MIEIRDLSVALGKKQVLEDVHFTARDGEFVALIGPNGSGKSTLLRSVARILPYRGEIDLDGKEIRHFERKAYARRLGMVSQFNDTGFEMTVRDMVLMGRTPYKSFFEGDGEEDFALVREALDIVGLSGYADRSLTALSGGERQRAVLARALVQETDHLLLDEATNHLDIYYAIRLLSLVRALNRTVIAALHDVNYALSYADRIVALKEGRLLFDKRTEAVGAEDIEALYGVGCTLAEAEGRPFVLFHTTI